MEYIALIIAGSLVGVGITKVTDKAVVRIADRLALRDWNKVVMRNFRKQRKERWKREVMRVALTFSPDECRGQKSEGSMACLAAPKVVDIREAVSLIK